MSDFVQIVIPALVALACTSWIHPYILKVAKDKNVVDNPDVRKLQRVPVPVLGGLTVVFGILSGLMVLNLFSGLSDMFPVFAAIVIILIVGMIDDMISLSPVVKLVVQIVLVLYMIFSMGNQISDFHGVWGFRGIPNKISIPLTVFACVGIINAINFIDGVDGYSSGYTIVSSLMFGKMFYALGDIQMVALSVIVAVSLIPFFLHNVFGKHSKMFIGDAGTLSLGIVFSTFVNTILSPRPEVAEFSTNLGLVPFVLAVLCVPVFDTLRVMTVRILRGKSPLSPDKTHLHHLFIELGYSHIGTTLSIIGINIGIVLCWYLAYRMGLSVDAQLYLVVVLGILVTFVFYPVVKKHIEKKTKVYDTFSRIAEKTHFERKGVWLLIQEFVDRSTTKDVGE
jgi:UDP-N-acetylmuramyl pentapeptide phosphotransferase/UDP-N-acetylglucosamine-1-phosphate transferase